ncbi:MAG: hypothetical protein KF768_04175 [Phycisphaeraceae bacterium]|nr:hypothetical protein [Phycisphaeraceae bacterium]
MASRTSKNTVLAGAFLLIALVAFVAVVIVLGDMSDSWERRRHYEVLFSLEDGAEGLDRGSVVKLGGTKVGTVVSSGLLKKEGTQEPIGVLVKIQVRADIDLYEDAIIQLAKPLLGSNSSINIVAVRGLGEDDPAYDGGTAKLEEGGRMTGTLGAPGFLSRSDYRKLQNIIADVNSITSSVKPRVDPIMEEVQGAVSDVRSITRDAAGRWPTWGERIDRATAEIDPIVGEVKTVLEQGRQFLASAQEVLDRNRAGFDEIVENVRVLTKNARGEAYDEVLAAIRRGREGLDSFASAAKQVDELLMTNAPALTDTIANANLAAQQLKLTTVEVRAAPWRLLYQPTKKELENELLFNSVRTYSMAVADLHAATQALNAVSARASVSPGAVDTATVDTLTRQLQDAFDRYQKHERQFIDRWIKQ